MSKRQNVNAQLDRAEVEASDNEESEEAGEFVRASAEVLAQRKRVTVRKSFGSTEPSQSIAVSNAAASSNPFSSFTGLTAANPPANPFSGFSGLTSKTPSTPAPAPAVPSKASAPIATSFSVPTTTPLSTPAASNSAASSDRLAEYKKKVKKLNQTFVSWIEKQMVDNSLTIWKDGMKDYLKYSSELATKFGVVDEEEEDTSSVKSKSTFPDPNTASLPPRSIPTNPFSVTAPSSDKSKSTFPDANTASAPLKPIPTNPFSVTAPEPALASAPPISAGSEINKQFSFAPANTTAKDALEVKSTSVASGAAPAASAAPFSFGTPAPAPTPALASTTFSFGTPAAAPAPAPALFKFGVPPLAEAPAPSSFSFSSDASKPFSFRSSTSANDSVSSSTATAATKPMFLFGAPAAAGGGLGLFGGPATASSANANGGDDEDGDDDEGEPILPPEVILKNENDKDIFLLDIPSKLHKFRPESKEWLDMGKGSLRITKDPATQRQRVMFRNTMGRILLNSYFFKTMQLSLDKNCVKFTAITFDETMNKSNLGNFYAKVKPEDSAAALDAMKAGIASLP